MREKESMCSISCEFLKTGIKSVARGATSHFVVVIACCCHSIAFIVCCRSVVIVSNWLLSSRRCSRVRESFSCF